MHFNVGCVMHQKCLCVEKWMQFIKNLFESVHCVQDTKEGRVGGVVETGGVLLQLSVKHLI